MKPRYMMHARIPVAEALVYPAVFPHCVQQQDASITKTGALLSCANTVTNTCSVTCTADTCFR